MGNHRLLPVLCLALASVRRLSTPRSSALRSSATSPIQSGAAMAGVAVTGHQRGHEHQRSV